MSPESQFPPMFHYLSISKNVTFDAILIAILDSHIFASFVRFFLFPKIVSFPGVPIVNYRSADSDGGLGRMKSESESVELN